MCEIGAFVSDLKEFRHLIGVFGDRYLGTRVLDLVRNLGWGQGSVDRHVGGPEIDCGEVDHVPLRSVVGEQHDTVAATDTELLQTCCEASGTTKELGSAQSRVSVEGVVEVVLFFWTFEFVAVQIEDVFLGHGCFPP